MTGLQTREIKNTDIIYKVISKLKDETQSNTTLRAITQRLCLLGTVVSNVPMPWLAPFCLNDHSIVWLIGGMLRTFSSSSLLVLHSFRTERARRRFVFVFVYLDSTTRLFNNNTCPSTE
jgi:hypothetical protein